MHNNNYTILIITYFRNVGLNTSTINLPVLTHFFLFCFLNINPITHRMKNNTSKLPNIEATIAGILTKLSALTLSVTFPTILISLILLSLMMLVLLMILLVELKIMLLVGPITLLVEISTSVTTENIK